MKLNRSHIVILTVTVTILLATVSAISYSVGYNSGRNEKVQPTVAAAATPNPVQPLFFPGYGQMQADMTVGNKFTVAIGNCSDGSTCALPKYALVNGEQLKLLDFVKEPGTKKPTTTLWQLSESQILSSTIQVPIEVVGKTTYTATWQINNSHVRGPLELGRSYLDLKQDLVQFTKIDATVGISSVVKGTVNTAPSLMQYIDAIDVVGSNQWRTPVTRSGVEFQTIGPVESGFATIKVEFGLPDIEDGGRVKTFGIQQFLDVPLVITQLGSPIYTAPLKSNGYINTIERMSPKPILVTNWYLDQDNMIWVKINGSGWTRRSNTNVADAELTKTRQVFSFK